MQKFRRAYYYFDDFKAVKILAIASLVFFISLTFFKPRLATLKRISRNSSLCSRNIFNNSVFGLLFISLYSIFFYNVITATDLFSQISQISVLSMAGNQWFHFLTNLVLIGNLWPANLMASFASVSLTPAISNNIIPALIGQT